MSLAGTGVYDLQWRKATSSIGNGACVEVAARKVQILIRDSQDPDGPTLSFSMSSWKSFLSNARNGRLSQDCL